MVENGGQRLPRPPRRIPAGAPPLTQLDTSTPRVPQQPPPRPPWKFGRFLAGFIVVLVVLAVGASAGWWYRAQSLRINTVDVLESVGHGVVRVLATTCEGTGEASGVLLEDNLVLTATSAIKQPLAIVIVTPDNKIRRANLLGNSSDGVAVLHVIGQLDDTPVPLAAADPDPKAELAQIGYTSAGNQRIQPVGTTEQPRALSEVMNAAKLGGPVVDKAGQVVGLVVGDTVPASTIIGVGKLRGYVAPKSTGITPEDGTCQRSRGPQGAVVPELQVASTPLAMQVQKLLGNYLTLENRQNFKALQALYSQQLKKSLTETRDHNSHQTSYFFGAKLTQILPNGSGADVRLAFNVLFAPTAKGAENLTCRRLDNVYHLVRQAGVLVINDTDAIPPAQACDS